MAPLFNCRLHARTNLPIGWVASLLVSHGPPAFDCRLALSQFWVSVFFLPCMRERIGSRLGRRCLLLPMR